MQWYLAKLVFRIICGNGEHKAQFDEQLRLIYAEDALHAYNKAHLTGEKEQENFFTQAKKLAEWKFINVTELHVLENITDGAEVYANIHEVENGDNYQHAVHIKARYLSENCTEQFIQTL